MIPSREPDKAGHLPRTICFSITIPKNPFHPVLSSPCNDNSLLSLANNISTVINRLQRLRVNFFRSFLIRHKYKQIFRHNFVMNLTSPFVIGIA